MKKGLWATICVGLVGANINVANAIPFETSPGIYGWTTFSFIGQELSSGQNVTGSFSFVTSGPASGYTSPVSVSGGGGSASFDVDRFFLAGANLNYDDGRFMTYAQQGACADTIGGTVGGTFNRSTPCGPTMAPELGFSLSSDLSFLTAHAGSNIAYDQLVSQLLSGPSLHIQGRYGCSGGQTTAGAPADFGLNGYCGGSPDLFGRYSGTLTAVAVPEPGTLGLFALGALGLIISRRRRHPPA